MGEAFLLKPAFTQQVNCKKWLDAPGNLADRPYFARRLPDLG
jgi:hypothetical protein